MKTFPLLTKSRAALAATLCLSGTGSGALVGQWNFGTPADLNSNVGSFAFGTLLVADKEHRCPVLPNSDDQYGNVSGVRHQKADNVLFLRRACSAGRKGRFGLRSDF